MTHIKATIIMNITDKEEIEKKSFFPIYFFLAIILIFFTNQRTKAEQTIINIPSSEVLPAQNFILKESNRFNSHLDNGTTTLTPSVIFGTGHGFEFATGVGTTFNDNNIIKGNFTAKKIFFLGNSTRLTVGGSISPYFTTSTTPDSFIYTHLTQRIKKTRTTLTAGIYMHGQKRMPNENGVLLGAEQVIIPNKLRLAIDWISGDDAYVKMGVGLKYKPISTLSITSAIIVPNRDEDTIGFNLSLSKFMTLDDFKNNRKENLPCQKEKNL